jgi:hypothetical protein
MFVFFFARTLRWMSGCQILEQLIQIAISLNLILISVRFVFMWDITAFQTFLFL